MAEKRKTSGSSAIDNLSIQAGKLPPQAVELEEAVLGAVMLEKNAIHVVTEFLKPECFYKDAHRTIFEVIMKLFKEMKAIDMLTVSDELRNQRKLEEVGGYLYITMLTSKIASAAHLEFHARIIVQKYIQRELIRVSSEIQKRAFDDNEDIDNLLDFSENELFNIAQGSIKKDVASITVLIDDAFKHIEKAGEKGEGLIGVPSGFTSIDRITSGWQKSDLVIIAARPSMGKTAFVLSMARNIAVEHNRPVAIFSLEMSSLQLVNRLIVSETHIPGEKIKNGRLEPYEWEQMEIQTRDLAKSPLYIDDSAAISIFELRAKARRLKQQYKIELLIVDYLQLMTGGGDIRGGNREQEVSNISRSLKAMAKDLEIPVIALSQLNRSVEMRSGDKRPQLSDLRESGAIEQDADIVMFIHRPEKYGITQDEEGNSTKGLAEIIIAKHRNGAIADVSLKFQEKYAQFSEFNMISDDLAEPVPDDGSLKVPSRMNRDYSEKNKDIRENTNFDTEKDEIPF
ncbi:MAG: replicative DNA helicase [Bacteroidota bacterium]